MKWGDISSLLPVDGVIVSQILQHTLKYLLFDNQQAARQKRNTYLETFVFLI